MAVGKQIGVIYLVKRGLDGRWNITRDGKPAGRYMLDEYAAVCIACEAARLDTSPAGTSVWAIQGGPLHKVAENGEMKAGPVSCVRNA